MCMVIPIYYTMSLIALTLPDRALEELLNTPGVKSKNTNECPTIPCAVLLTNYLASLQVIQQMTVVMC